MSGFPLERAYGRVDYFCESSIQLEYGPGDEVQFIGASGHAQLNFTFRGVDVFSISATEFFSLMAASDDSGHHEFDRNEYCFPNQTHALGC
ncbi:hypothetical protein [Pseudomonas trivialis]|uniref:hypothetical protein n=1 Tax=Pseudomonas trivialis TaxID=200450 RepID=UPI001E319E0F|nr:hypothetical protein [Pseudomonas trivialis]